MIKRHGGRRRGAGAPRSNDKKEQLEIYVPATVIKKFGGEEKLLNRVYKFLGVSRNRSNSSSEEGES